MNKTDQTHIWWETKEVISNLTAFFQNLTFGWPTSCRASSCLKHYVTLSIHLPPWIFLTRIGSISLSEVALAGIKACYYFAVQCQQNWRHFGYNANLWCHWTSMADQRDRQGRLLEEEKQGGDKTPLQNNYCHTSLPLSQFLLLTYSHDTFQKRFLLYDTAIRRTLDLRIVPSPIN